MIHAYAQRCLEVASSPHVRAMVATIVAACTARNIRLTPLRLRILELIAAYGRPVKAYELLEDIRRDRGHAGPPTVYRTLDFLVAHGLVHKVASLGAFVMCRHPDAVHHRPLLVCERCGDVTELEDTATGRTLDSAARACGFRPVSKMLEIQGVCAKCAGGAA